MRCAQVMEPNPNGTNGTVDREVDQTILIVNDKETEIIIRALHLYTTSNKRSKLAQRLLADTAIIPMSPSTYSRLIVDKII